jgi:hypothetical protein
LGFERSKAARGTSRSRKTEAEHIVGKIRRTSDGTVHIGSFDGRRKSQDDVSWPESVFVWPGKHTRVDSVAGHGRDAPVTHGWRFP